MTPNAKITKEEARKFWKDRGRDIDLLCTCNDCELKDTCMFAWNLYNADGNCKAADEQ